MTRQRTRLEFTEYLIFHEDGTTSLKPDAPKEVVEYYNKIQNYDDRRLP